MSDYGSVTDGYATWSRCGPDCTLEVVRIGKTQCIDLWSALNGIEEPGDRNCPDWPATEGGNDE